MISPESVFELLKKNDINFFAGVPDSLLSNFCAYINDNVSPQQHIITANEGNAVALATGYHLSTGKVGAIYMQNSGLGNAVNPLTSLTSTEVYKIPMLLIIGWRGEPGVQDEPQHIKQGSITTAQLELLDIPYWVLENNSNINDVITSCIEKIRYTNAPVALLVRQKTFAEYKSESSKRESSKRMNREEVLQQLLDLIDTKDLIVATTGKTSRELYELRDRRSELKRDFLTVGSMGHTSSIALGVSLGNIKRRVICLDGDGSLLMHMGMMPVIGDVKPVNLIHILLNNSAHESVGGQPTVAGKVDFSSLSRACGYTSYFLVEDFGDLYQCWKEVQQIQGPILIEIHISLGSRSDLGRPKVTPEQNKFSFMEHAHE